MRPSSLPPRIYHSPSPPRPSSSLSLPLHLIIINTIPGNKRAQPSQTTPTPQQRFRFRFRSEFVSPPPRSTPPPPASRLLFHRGAVDEMKKMQIGGGGDRNSNETEGGDHKAALRQKKLKDKKTLKCSRSSTNDMKSKVEAGASEGISDDTVLCSLTTASFKSLVSRKTVRTLGKVAQQCDAIDAPVPRRLRSAINKRSRHVKKRRHLSAISDQISLVDQRTRFNETSLLAEEEEIADALLSLSQIPSTHDLTTDKVVADSMNINASSTSYPEGTTNEDDKITRVSNAADELSACIVGRTDNVPHVNQVPGVTNQSNNINPPLLENSQIKDLSLGVIVKLPSPCKDPSNNSAQKQLKMQLDDRSNSAARKPEAWLVDCNESVIHENRKTKNEGVQEIMHRVRTPLPCTPDGYLIKSSSSKLLVQANTVSEPASGILDKFPPVHNSVPTKTWKRSITHVYVSHLILQAHLNKEKERSSRIHASGSPNNGSTLRESNVKDETCYYAVRSDVRLPVHPSTGVCNMSAAGPGQQTMVSGNFLDSTALPGAQHVQYFHPQMTPRGPMPYQFPHLPRSTAHLAPAATLHQMQQYVCNPGQGYATRPGMTANSSSAMMKLQHLMPTQYHHQQQQAWRFHVAHQYQPRPDAAWLNMGNSLRPMSALPTPTAMELLCAPYQGGGRSRQPQELRLI